MFYAALKNPFDLSVFHAINGLSGHSQLLDTIMIVLAKDALEIYAVLFLVAWFTLPKRDLEGRHALVIAGFSGILALLFNVVISHVWFRPRPFTVLPHGTYSELVSHSNDASFPSDHTSGSFGFASATWGKAHKWISTTFTVLAVLVMFARVYVGVHYPTDVIGGMIVGIIASRIMWKFSRWLLPFTRAVARIFGFGPAKHARR